MPAPAVMPYVDGELPLTFPDTQNEGPSSSNGRMGRPDPLNLYCVRTGTSHVITVAGDTLFDVPFGSTLANVKFVGRYSASISIEKLAGDATANIGLTT